MEVILTKGGLVGFHDEILESFTADPRDLESRVTGLRSLNDIISEMEAMLSRLEYSEKGGED